MHLLQELNSNANEAFTSGVSNDTFENARKAMQEYYADLAELDRKCVQFGRDGKSLSRINEYYGIEVVILQDRLVAKLQPFANELDAQVVEDNLERARTLSSGIIYDICFGKLRKSLGVSDSQVAEIKQLARESEEDLAEKLYLLEGYIVRQCLSPLDKQLQTRLLSKMEQKIPNTIPMVRTLIANPSSPRIDSRR